MNDQKDPNGACGTAPPPSDPATREITASESTLAGNRALINHVQKLAEFHPVVSYDRTLEQVICLRKDVSYRVDWIDGNLELLWHPYKPEVVGIKLTVGSFSRLRRALDISPTQPLPLKRILELMRSSLDPNQEAYHRAFYRMALEAVGDAELAPEEERS